MPKLDYRLTNDTFFKMYFTQHPDLLKSFVAALLDIRLESIGQFSIANSERIPDSMGEKIGRLDINMTVDGQRVDLKIQVVDEGDSC